MSFDRETDAIFNAGSGYPGPKPPENGDREEVGNLRMYPVLTLQQKRVMELTDQWFGEFLKKNADYSHQTFSTGDILGAKGQYAELVRKVFKLQGPLWEGKTMNFEQPEEIIRDLIGHCFLALVYLEKEGSQVQQDLIKAKNDLLAEMREKADKDLPK